MAPDRTPSERGSGASFKAVPEGEKGDPPQKRRWSSDDPDAQRREQRLKILILTGERGVGKSTVCERSVALARCKGLDCAGIITIRRLPNRLDVQDVRSGATRRLTLPPGAESAVHIGPYRFNAATVAWGNSLLRAAFPCDLLIVDELGPLEFERRQGWTAAFDVLYSAADTLPNRADALAIVVVRPWLVARAQQALSPGVVGVLSVNLGNRDSLPQVLASRVPRR